MEMVALIQLKLELRSKNIKPETQRYIRMVIEKAFANATLDITIKDKKRPETGLNYGISSSSIRQ